MRDGARRLAFRLTGGTHFGHRAYHPVLVEALGPGRDRGRFRSDISDHLGFIFYFAVDAAPRLIVELGTRGGESTRALLAAARTCDATMLSVDIDDCGGIEVPFRDRWNFVRADDVAFGREGFVRWCDERSIAPRIDVLFIDTSHEYEHTRQELEAWTPHLAPRGVMLFHDTNMGRGVYARLDGSTGVGWNNNRDVIRAIEGFVSRRYDEQSFFSDLTDQFAILHLPNCNGLTIMRRRS